MTFTAPPQVDTGTGYGRPAPSYNERLTHTGPGTPMGELLRRYWQPIARVEDATSIPKRVRILGEDLVLFRDGRGQPGLLTERCSHRGASLFFGRVEADGLRCCYHGWKFDCQGICLDQATEVDGGRRRDVARQPWYPVQERYGLIFAYLGPPEQKPVLPRYTILENLAEGEFLEVSWNPGYGPEEILDFNWLQSFENSMDQMHVLWLHNRHSGTQFTFETERLRPLPDDFDLHGATEGCVFEIHENSVTAALTAPAGDSGEFVRITIQSSFPNTLTVPGVSEMAWFVPVDDTHHLVIQVGVVTEPGTMATRVIGHNGKRWEECTPEELQRMPGDYEAQRSQGEITFHSDEHLAASDRGVIMIRRGLEQRLAALAAGDPLPGVSFDPDAPPVTTLAGSTLIDAPPR